MSTIDHSDMVSVLTKIGIIIADEMTGENAHLLHMVVGVARESAELLEAYDNNRTFGIALGHENVLEKLGDTELYLEGLRQGLNVTRDLTLACVVNEADIFGEVIESTAAVSAIKFTVHSGRLLDLINKVVIYQKDVPTDEIVEALAKIEVILGVIRDEMGFTRQDCLDANIAKLGERYESFKYSESRY